MKIRGDKDQTFILLNGISTPQIIEMGDGIELQPANCSHLDLGIILKLCQSHDDISVFTAFLPRISAQIKIVASTPKLVATKAWNVSWDILAIAALFNTEIGFNIQSNICASQINLDSILESTNNQMLGFNTTPNYELTVDDVAWLRKKMGDIHGLMDLEKFSTAIHCLASYRWHLHPRVRLSIIWTGIESLFNVDTELRFRISIYISRFLHGDDPGLCKNSFQEVKRLYDIRSKAVHGSTTSKDFSKYVDQSAKLLRELIKKCIDKNSLPIEDELVP